MGDISKESDLLDYYLEEKKKRTTVEGDLRILELEVKNFKKEMKKFILAHNVEFYPLTYYSKKLNSTFNFKTDQMNSEKKENNLLRRAIAKALDDGIKSEPLINALRGINEVK